MSLLKKLAGETAIYGLSSILGRTLHFFLLTPYLTYGPLREGDAYGRYSLMYSAAAFLAIIYTQRMETAFFRFGNEQAARALAFGTASASVALWALLLSAAGLWAARPIAEAIELGGHPEYLRYFLLIVAFDALAAIPFAKLRLDGRPWRFAALKMGNILLNIALVFAFYEWLGEGARQALARSFGIRDAVGYAFVANLLASAALFLAVGGHYLRWPWRFDAALWRRMMGYALPLVAVGFAGIVNEMLDRFLLLRLLPGDLSARQTAIGLYSANYKLAILMSLFVQAYNYAAEPFFFRHAQRADARQLYAQAGRLFALVGSVGLLAILLYLDVVQYFIGSNFREGLAVVPILLFANLFLGLYYNVAIWYKLSDRTGIGAYVAIGGAAITVLANYWLIPGLGYVGSAWATLLCYAAMLLATYALGQRYFPIPYPIGRIAAYAGGALLAYALSLCWPPHWPNGLPRLAANTGLFALYLGLLWQLDLRRLWPQLAGRA